MRWPGAGADPAPIGHQDLGDRLGVRSQRVGQPQRPPLPERGKGDGRGPAVEGGGKLGRQRLGVEEDRLQARARQGEPKRGPGQAGADNDDVRVIFPFHIWRSMLAAWALCKDWWRARAPCCF